MLTAARNYKATMVPELQRRQAAAVAAYKRVKAIAALARNEYTRRRLKVGRCRLTPPSG